MIHVLIGNDGRPKTIPEPVTVIAEDEMTNLLSIEEGVEVVTTGINDNGSMVWELAVNMLPPGARRQLNRMDHKIDTILSHLRLRLPIE